MQLKPHFLRLKVHGWALAAGVLVGFLAGMLIFGSPWRLPPAWGDIPSWFLAIGAGLTAWYAHRAYSKQAQEVAAIEQQVADAQAVAAQQAELLGVQNEQLELQRQQLDDQRALNVQQTEVLRLQAEDLSESLIERKREAERSVRRDELLTRQLAEAEDREKSWRRRLAEDIEVPWVGSAGHVINNSGRPITDITGKLVSGVDRRSLAAATQSGTLTQLLVPGTPWQLLDVKDYDRIAVLRPHGRAGFIFPDLDAPEAVFVVWFTDDEKRRWQLDQYGHLVESADESEYID